MSMPSAANAAETLTFVLRLWREVDASGRSLWRGRVEHVASQEVGYVQDAGEVVRFIERWTGHLGGSEDDSAGVVVA